MIRYNAKALGSKILQGLRLFSGIIWKHCLPAKGIFDALLGDNLGFAGVAQQFPWDTSRLAFTSFEHVRGETGDAVTSLGLKAVETGETLQQREAHCEAVEYEKASVFGGGLRFSIWVKPATWHSMLPRKGSLVVQSLDRIQLCGLGGWVEAEENTYEH